MCRPSSFNFQAMPVPIIDGVQSSQELKNLTSSLSTALLNVKQSQSENSSNNNSRKQPRHHHHIVVEHHYHDHANEDTFADERPARGGVTTPFPIRLHKMLDRMDADGHADVISWQPHGRCFVVHKPKEFKELLPTYFKLSKMSSFQRQLNLYGFQRLTRGRDKNGYYHEYFLRGKPVLSNKIQRTKVKGTGVRARSNPSTEPHLWEMLWVGTGAGEAHDNNSGYSDTGSVSSHEDQFHHDGDDGESPEASPMPPLKSQSAFAVHNISSSVFSLPPLMTSSIATTVAPNAVESSPFVMVSTSSWSQQQQQQPLLTQQQTTSTTAWASSLFEQDVITSFGGKKFHYLDPQEMLKEAQLRKKQMEASQQRDDDMQEFMSSLDLDHLYSELDEEAMDNDDAFMHMLERVIE